MALHLHLALLVLLFFFHPGDAVHEINFPRIHIATTRHGVKLCASPGGPHPCDCLHAVPSGSRVERRHKANRVHLPNGTVLHHKECPHALPPKPKPPPHDSGNTTANDTPAPSSGSSSCSSVTNGYYHGRPFNAYFISSTTNIASFDAKMSVPASPSQPTSGAVDGSSEYLFYWVGLQDTRDATSPVLQPVLSYSASGIPNAEDADDANNNVSKSKPIWYYMSWNCCPNGHKYSAAGVPVSGPGAELSGKISCPSASGASTDGEEPEPAGTCTVTSKDSSGRSSILTLDDSNVGAPTWDWAIVELETYGIKTCSSYAGGTAAFTDMTMTSVDGEEMSPSGWTNNPYVQIKSSATAETPMPSSFSACCGGEFDMGWPTQRMSQNGNAHVEAETAVEAELARVRTNGAVVDFELQLGGVPDDQKAAANNTARLSAAFGRLRPGDTLLISNKTFWLAGGLRAVGLDSVTVQLDGTLRFLPGRKSWPVQHECNKNPLQPTKNSTTTCVQEAFFVANVTNLTLTSSGTGTLHGAGDSWWGYGAYLIHGEDRPRLLSLLNGTDILMENWRFEQSAYWTVTAFDVARLEIRGCAIDNRVNDDDEHSLANLGAFNTDGFDVAGRDIHIHNCSVWNQDDCFTIQPLDGGGINAQCTENILVEHVAASGLGLTVGAIHPSARHACIKNVTFRAARMHHTFKGIYVKSGMHPIHGGDAGSSGEVTDVLFQDIVMSSPSQVPIWIGPAQEADSSGACSLVWPEVPLSKCPPPPTTMSFTNITLRDVVILSPKQSPGVVLGNPARPMQHVLFDNVTVVPADPKAKPWGKDFYHCVGVDGVATGGTSPVPPCFVSA